MRPASTRLGALAAAVSLGLALLTGCTGGTGDATSNAGGAEPAAVEDGVAAPEAAAAGPAGEAAQQSALSDAAAGQRQVVRTGQVIVEVETLATSAARVRQAALDARGFVASETTGSASPVDPIPLDGDEPVGRSAAPGESVIVLRVPEARFAAVLDSVAAIGTELSRTTRAEDVTGEVADLTSRTATAKASVDRIRVLLADAKDLKDIVLLESELTRREADLEAYQARLAALSGQAEMSTITAVLRTPQAGANEPNSFLRGLQQGWVALQDSTAALFVLIGALLPFALVLALVGLPLWTLLRHRRRPAGSSGPAGPSDPPSTAPPSSAPSSSGPDGPADPPGPAPSDRDPVSSGSTG